MIRLFLAVSMIIVASVGQSIASAAHIIVLQSDTPRFSEGQILDSESVIELDEGDELLLAAEAGTFSITGPYAGPPTGGDTADQENVLKALGQLLGKRSTDTGDLGVIRGAGGAKR